jgi:hypothetical protein
MLSGERRLPILLTIAAALLRFSTIDVQSYWFDEALTVKLTSSPLGQMLSDIPRSELTPPLYYLVAWPWAHVFGTDEVAMRSLSALFGIALVPVAYLLGRELASHVTGVVAAALVAFNPLLVWYSQETRPYSMFALLCALSLLFCVRAAREGTRRPLVWWTVLSAAAVLTHYFAAFLVVPEAAVLAWVLRPRRPALVAGGVVGAVGVALIPLAAYSRSKIGTGYIDQLPLGRRLIGVPEDYLTGFVVKFGTTPEKLLDGIALALAAVALFLVVTRTNVRERQGALIATAAAGVTAGIPGALATVNVDYLNTRNVIAGCVPALLLVAVGFGAARVGRAVRLAGTAALCAVGVASVVIVASDNTFHRENWRGIAEALGPARDERVIVVPPASGEVGLEVQIGGLTRVPPAGATVREVDVVTPRSELLGGKRSGRPAQPQPPGPRFRLAERRYEDDFTLLRWVAPQPVRVSPAQLAAAGQGVVAAAVPLLQRAGG